jgi:hypothetical protein
MKEWASVVVLGQREEGDKMSGRKWTLQDQLLHLSYFQQGLVHPHP